MYISKVLYEKMDPENQVTFSKRKKHYSQSFMVFKSSESHTFHGLEKKNPKFSPVMNSYNTGIQSS